MLFVRSAKWTPFLHGSAERATVLNNLGNAYMIKHGQEEDERVLEKSLACWKELLALVPPHDPSKPMYLSNFGNAKKIENLETEKLV